MTKVIDLTDAEYQWLLKIASGMRNVWRWQMPPGEDKIEMRLQKTLSLTQWADQTPNPTRCLTERGRAAMREYERKHNVSAESE